MNEASQVEDGLDELKLQVAHLVHITRRGPGSVCSFGDAPNTLLPWNSLQPLMMEFSEAPLWLKNLGPVLLSPLFSSAFGLRDLILSLSPCIPVPVLSCLKNNCPLPRAFHVPSTFHFMFSFNMSFLEYPPKAGTYAILISQIRTLSTKRLNNLLKVTQSAR